MPSFIKIVQAVKKLNSISRERLNFRRRLFCVQLCIETLCKQATSVAHLTNFSFEFFNEISTEDASLRLLYHGAKKSKMTKNSNQGGSCLKLTRSELFVEPSKKTPSLKSTSLSTRRFAAYASFFEVAWRNNLDDHSRDRAHACKTRGFHCHTLELGKYATEIRSPRHVQLDFSRTRTSAN